MLFLSVLLYSTHVFHFQGHRVVSGTPAIVSPFLLGYRGKRKKSQQVFSEVPPHTFSLYLTGYPSCQRHGEVKLFASSSL